MTSSPASSRPHTLSRPCIVGVLVGVTACVIVIVPFVGSGPIGLFPGLLIVANGLGAGGLLGSIAGLVARAIIEFAAAAIVGTADVVRVIGISMRSWSLPGLPGVLARRAVGGGARAQVIGLLAGGGWRMMCTVSWLMPRAAGRRWLAEAGSFLAETPPAQRRPAIRSYLGSRPSTPETHIELILSAYGRV